MASVRDIKNRIKSVSNTQKITSAMKLVATGKLRGARMQIEQSRPFFETLYETLSDIAKQNKEFSSPFTAPATDKVCHIVIAGDKGLAGGYNINLIKSTDIKDGDVVLPIGKKAMEFFEGRDVSIISDRYNLVENMTVSDCDEIGRMLKEGVLKGVFGKLNIYYTEFVNILSQRPAMRNILPIKDDSGEKKSKSLILYEPSGNEVFRQIVPYYISGMVFGAVCESRASELAARCNAMEAASEAAGEIIGELTTQYNRVRQAEITQELIEIVSGTQGI